tara:strand:- start:7691 stop:8125 length:435 start_codon:yes stop_codon:yes gene_type:complete
VDFSITVPGVPMAQPRPRATSFGGKSRVYQPKPARDSKATIQSHASEWIENNPNWKRLEGPIAVRITAVFKCPTSDYRKRNPRLAKFKSNGPDVDNVAKHYMDALCASGIVCDDDRQVASLQVLKIQAAQGEPPYTKIEIVPLM